MQAVNKPGRWLCLPFLLFAMPALAATVSPAAAPAASCPMGGCGVMAVLLPVLIAIIIVWLGACSDMLRDSVPTDFGVPGKKYRRTYSLAQTQMMLWFVIIIGSFIYLYCCTGGMPVVSDQALWLMGIGTGTALGAGAIDKQKSNPTLDTFESVLQQIATRRTQGVPDVAMPALISQRDDLLQRLASRDFLSDLLSDQNGLCMHRVQVLFWTITLGVVFMRQVVLHCQMPPFDPNELALMGISAGTYIGFKIPEQAA
jgi:hypothetical protein